MVVIYDRFVFFSVEKFFIPLLYSCLNILVQRSCASTSERVRICVVCGVYACVCVYACARASVYMRPFRVSLCAFICVDASADVCKCMRARGCVARECESKEGRDESDLSEKVTSAGKNK